jgi:hypothetical protein
MTLFQPPQTSDSGFRRSEAVFDLHSQTLILSDNQFRIQLQLNQLRRESDFNS